MTASFMFNNSFIFDTKSNNAIIKVNSQLMSCSQISYRSVKLNLHGCSCMAQHAQKASRRDKKNRHIGMESANFIGL